MKKILPAVFIVFALLNSASLFAQNIMINVLTQNSGEVKKGEVIFFEVTIYNTSPTKALPIYKIRPQISFPTSLVSIPETGHVLPPGWTITFNKKGEVFLSNGTDVLPENSSRTILIALKGKEIGGPAIINGNLFFSNGFAPGTLGGTSTKEDNIADNSSASTIKVF